MPIFGGTVPVTSLETIGSLNDAAAAGALDASSLGSGAGFAAGTAPSMTIGSLASGVGLGFGAGSLLGGFVQNAFGKTGPAPTIGAGVGAAAGAAIGSIIPGIGTVIGGLLGGLLGGARGGLIYHRRT
jgi:hypothetical protein